MADAHATPRPRYSATVSDVRHWTAPPDERQDVDRVLVHLDYAAGAMWWLADKGAVKVGDRYMIEVSKL